MATVTKQQIIDFVNSQPAHRPVNMCNCSSGNQCGCVMVDYGREVLNIEEKFTCGYTDWRSVKNNKHLAFLECKISGIIKGWDSIKTYGDIQKYLLSVDKSQ